MGGHLSPTRQFHFVSPWRSSFLKLCKPGQLVIALSCGSGRYLCKHLCTEMRLMLFGDVKVKENIRNLKCLVYKMYHVLRGLFSCQSLQWFQAFLCACGWRSGRGADWEGGQTVGKGFQGRGWKTEKLPLKEMEGGGMVGRSVGVSGEVTKWGLRSHEAVKPLSGFGSCAAVTALSALCLLQSPDAWGRMVPWHQPLTGEAQALAGDGQAPCSTESPLAVERKTPTTQRRTERRRPGELWVPRLDLWTTWVPPD